MKEGVSIIKTSEEPEHKLISYIKSIKISYINIHIINIKWIKYKKWIIHIYNIKIKYNKNNILK
jgi:hypothetical protein